VTDLARSAQFCPRLELEMLAENDRGVTLALSQAKLLLNPARSGTTDR
jgi:hypothetical protein